MTARAGRFIRALIGACVCLGLLSCGGSSKTAGGAADPHLATNGTVEVTAQLVEVPQGAIFKRDLYDYATILKYKVLKVASGRRCQAT